MTVMQVQLLLFTGVVSFVLSASFKYYLIQERKTWNDARAYCRATHTDLAIIKSSDDLIQLQNEALRLSFSSGAWIGLYNDINSWRWSFNNEPLTVTYWALGEPNNNGGHKECGGASWFFWFDATCSTLMPFLCFDARNSATAKFIYISGLKISWYDARSYCRQHHTDLAIIRDNTDCGAIQNLVSIGNAWIGLFRDAWKWIDKTNMSTIKWASGQPDNFWKNENCGFISNGQAADASCSDTRPFFCYSEITGRKQTIRVKIQSRQNVNDPAVKAAILDKIKEKLMEQGMAANATVKWIEQPDGLVFHKERRHESNAENKTEESCDP